MVHNIDLVVLYVCTAPVHTCFTCFYLSPPVLNSWLGFLPSCSNGHLHLQRRLNSHQDSGARGNLVCDTQELGVPPWRWCQVVTNPAEIRQQQYRRTKVFPGQPGRGHVLRSSTAPQRTRKRKCHAGS